MIIRAWLTSQLGGEWTGSLALLAIAVLGLPLAVTLDSRRPDGGKFRTTTRWQFALAVVALVLFVPSFVGTILTGFTSNWSGFVIAMPIAVVSEIVVSLFYFRTIP